MVLAGFGAKLVEGVNSEKNGTDLESGGAKSVPIRSISALTLRNSPIGAKSALTVLGLFWLLGPIQFFSFYSVLV